MSAFGHRIPQLHHATARAAMIRRRPAMISNGWYHARFSRCSVPSGSDSGTVLSRKAANQSIEQSHVSNSLLKEENVVLKGTSQSVAPEKQNEIAIQLASDAVVSDEASESSNHVQNQLHEVAAHNNLEPKTADGSQHKANRLLSAAQRSDTPRSVRHKWPAPPRVRISPTPEELSLAASQRDNVSLPCRRAIGRSCLVTGATSGIGYAVTKLLVLEGATHIRIITRDISRGEEAIKRIKQETSCHDFNAEVIQLDLEDELHLTKSSEIFGSTCSWPNVDTAVLCAGISQSKLTTHTKVNEVSNILKVNLNNAIFLSNHYIRTYLETFGPNSRRKSDKFKLDCKSSPASVEKSFCLVTIASLLAHKGGYGASVYAASKLGLVGFNRALSLEAGAIYKKKLERWPQAPAFRVNTVSPGYIDTPMTEGIAGAGRGSLQDQIPLGRFGKAEEVADAVLFLIGNEYASNCEINLDGGLSAT